MHFVRYQGVYPPKTELSIRMMFHVSGRRAGDIDNLQKLVLDAIQDAGVVSNDMYVTEIHGSVDRCQKGQDRTAVVIHPR